jgi:hypothetical protein
MRTEKSCGPDAPTLASSCGAIRKRRWQKSPVTGESTKETVKAIAQGRLGVSGEPVVTMLVWFFIPTRGCGCNGHPAFPAPSILSREKVRARLGQITPRDRGFASALLLWPILRDAACRPLLRMRSLGLARRQTLMVRRRVAPSRTTRPPVGSASAL